MNAKHGWMTAREIREWEELPDRRKPVVIGHRSQFLRALTSALGLQRVKRLTLTAARNEPMLIEVERHVTADLDSAAAGVVEEYELLALGASEASENRPKGIRRGW